jgi:predicted transcriptional regulator
LVLRSNSGKGPILGFVSSKQKNEKVETNMKTIGRKILTGTMIASFVLGVGFVGALHNQAYADTASGTSSSTSVQKSDKAGFGGQGGFGARGGRQGGNVVKETATILGVEQSVVEEALKADKTLAAFAVEKGLTEADYLQKLIAAETTSITAEVTAGKITQAQADKLIAGLSDQLTKQIENKGFGNKGKGFGGNHLVEQTATVLKVDKSAVEDALKAGKTLAAYATEKGLTEADYLQKLVAAETTSINAEVTAGKLTQVQADKMLSGLSDRLTKQIESTGPVGGAEGKRGGMGFGNSEVLTQILGITQDELRTQQEAGQSIADIASAKGISEADLISKMKDGMTDSIKKFVENKHTRPTGDATADTAAPAVN